MSGWMSGLGDFAERGHKGDLDRFIFKPVYWKGSAWSENHPLILIMPKIWQY